MRWYHSHEWNKFPGRKWRNEGIGGMKEVAMQGSCQFYHHGRMKNEELLHCKDVENTYLVQK